MGNYSLNYHYQAKALISGCVNYGPVSGKQDYVGGVVGQAYLGLVMSCQGYGAADSDGSYVGGIAGASEGTIRRSWAKCSLSGTDYVGGIAGYGENLDTCRALVTVSGEAYVGAIAGDVDENGTVKKNVFTTILWAGWMASAMRERRSRSRSRRCVPCLECLRAFLSWS